MSSKQKRKTRLKGTETRKPCVDCGELKDRFKDFKPRWAGCSEHKTERGRRVYTPGCADCEAVVNGNIRQPRCVECDKARPKKRKAKATEPKVTVVTVDAAGVATIEGDPEAVTTPKSDLVPEGASDLVMSEAKPEDLSGLPERVETPEPVVEAQPEASEASADVTPEPTSAQPAVTNMADLLTLLSDDDTQAEDWE